MRPLTFCSFYWDAVVSNEIKRLIFLSIFADNLVEP